MPRIPVRVEPYSSPSKQHRHFKNKRDQILKALGKASYINGSHFAILWVNSRGESESYASDVFQAKLADWFGPKVLHDAKSLVAAAVAAHDGHAERRFSAAATDIDDELDGEEKPKQQEQKPDLVLSLLPPAPPELHRSFSMPSQISPLDDHHFNTSLMSTSSFTEYKPLTIGSTPQVSAFLETRFRQLQQMVCKIVAKAWIKIIEPKKQTRYPYNRGEDSKPDWWPENVRHKEPDHLMKPERISLLLKMLRCGKVPVNRLELATAEVAAYIPPDKTNLLREIYRVAREEERLKSGEIDPSTKIYVASTASPSGDDEAPSPTYQDHHPGIIRPPSRSNSIATSIPELAGNPFNSTSHRKSEPPMINRSSAQMPLLHPISTSFPKSFYYPHNQQQQLYTEPSSAPPHPKLSSSNSSVFFPQNWSAEFPSPPPTAGMYSYPPPLQNPPSTATFPERSSPYLPTPLKTGLSFSEFLNSPTGSRGHQNGQSFDIQNNHNEDLSDSSSIDREIVNVGA